MQVGEEVRELQVEPLQWPAPYERPQAEPIEAPQKPAHIPEAVPV